MKDFNELIRKRRSIRQFTSEELSQDDVVTLLKAALMAPTSRNTKSWQFVVVDDKELLQKLSLCKENSASFIADAAVAIVVTADPMTSDVWIEDASIAAAYIQLQAEDLGLGSCWVQVLERMYSDTVTSNDYIHGLLNIPRMLQVVSVIAIGHKKIQLPPRDEEKLEWEKIHINTYDEK